MRTDPDQPPALLPACGLQSAPQPSALEPAPSEAPPALDWLLALLQQAMTEVMAGEAPPVQKANAVARLGSLYLKTCHVGGLQRSHKELSRRVAALERRLAARQPAAGEGEEPRAREADAAGATEPPIESPGVETPVCTHETRRRGLGQRRSSAPVGELAGDIDSDPTASRPPEPVTVRGGKQPIPDPTPPPPRSARRTRDRSAGQPDFPLPPGDLPSRSGPRLSDVLFERFADALNQRAAAAPDGSNARGLTEE